MKKKGARSGKGAKRWIQKALAKHKKGSLHRQLGVSLGETIPLSLLRKAEKKGGLIAKRAYLAETLRRLRRRKKTKRAK